MNRHPIPRKLKDKAKAKYEGHCAYCGERPEKLQVDHIRPVSGGGTNHIENLNPACAKCNNFKMNLTVEQFRYELSQQVERARSYSVNFRNAERFGMLQVIEKPIRFYFEQF